jgi:haloacetate dehalogenase
MPVAVVVDAMSRSRNATPWTIGALTGKQHERGRAMDRRSFAAMGIAGLTGLWPGRGFTQTQAPSPDGLSRALPSPLAPPAATLLQLPELPAAESPAIRRSLFDGFTSRFIAPRGATLRVMTKGDGPPLLLIHGHPETHVTWHKVAPVLAQHYTVVLPDLRGYGDSSKPDYSPNSENYSFRAMAQDMVDVMTVLGHRRFRVAGHDRGGRVAHRLCLDHPDAVEKVATLDIAPTLTMYQNTSKEFATRYLWWFLQIQPSPLPEHLIGLDPGYYLRDHLFVQGKTPGAVTPEAMAEYIRCYCCTGTIRAVCEDYRAAAGIDLEMDRADETAGNKIRAPMLALWGAKGTVGELWDVLATWRPKVAGSLVGQALPCGHLLPEEDPSGVVAALQSFFEG